MLITKFIIGLVLVALFYDRDNAPKHDTSEDIWG